MAEDSGRRILLTGIAGALAGRLAARLEAEERVEYLAGMDLREPSLPLSRGEFIRADLRNPIVAKVIDSTEVDTVVHLDVAAGASRPGSRSPGHQLNVTGTLQLLAAAQQAARLRKLVLRSTTAVYGSSHTDPALFSEHVAPGAAPRSAYSKDAVEIEAVTRAFGRRRDDVVVSILRFATLISGSADSPLARYLTLPVVPTVLGYDPRLQLCHETDALEVLHRACLEEHPGIFNVAGPGIVYLSQAIRLAGRPAVAVPLPLVRAAASLVRRGGAGDLTGDQLQFLLYGRAADIGRLRTGFGYEPRYSTKAALVDFVADRRTADPVQRAVAWREPRELCAQLTRARSRSARSRRSPG